MSDIRRELEEVTSLKKKKSEDEQAYFGRLSEAVQKLPEDDWESLSEPAQVWCNKALKAIDSDKEIPSFPDDEEETGEPDAIADDGDEDEAPAKKAKGKGKKGNGAAKPKKEKAEKEPKEPSMRRTIKQLIVGDPTITIDDLNAKLKSSGFNPAKTTVASIRSDTLDTMKVLKDAGQLSA